MTCPHTEPPLRTVRPLIVPARTQAGAVTTRFTGPLHHISPTGFATWVARLADGPKAAGTGLGCTYRWIVEGDRVLGGIALRHGLDDQVPQFGHIGYGIRPSSRRRGPATWALGRILTEAWALGLDRVLMVCAVDNLASVRTIERHGGLLEGIRDTEHGPARRYWIKAQGASHGTRMAAPCRRRPRRGCGIRRPGHPSRRREWVAWNGPPAVWWAAGPPGWCWPCCWPGPGWR
ncbi:GNAT family N-acetyltransferase [Streptomyces virginiae]|uniref:GNAT family N-acetyltransferase n=1 Tax=Streptomyces virginiae TaxID=1961 RepID=UPI0036664CB4